MLVAITGDTHGKINQVKKQLQKLSPDYLLFTGDHLNDGKRLADALKLKNFYGVLGNCDSRAKAQEEMLEIGGYKILLTHGHQYGVKRSFNSIYYRGVENQADVIVFGHTHIALCQNINGVWLLNPGSPALPRGQTPPSYIIAPIEADVIIPSIVAL